MPVRARCPYIAFLLTIVPRSGDNYNSQPQFFKELIDSYDGSDIIGWVLRHKIRRWKHSVSTNPNFYLSPVTMVRNIAPTIPGLLTHSACFDR
jgi:hypothetical protein